jgi:hypothetical protein
MTKTQASVIKVGMKVCEADGFMWEVKAIKATKFFVTFSVSPVFKTAIGERDHDFRVKSTATMRVAS